LNMLGSLNVQGVNTGGMWKVSLGYPLMITDRSIRRMFGERTNATTTTVADSKIYYSRYSSCSPLDNLTSRYGHV
jgi:hypothetical protein